MAANAGNVLTHHIPAGSNTIGAIIFFTYIVAALAFTFIIVRDIVVLRIKQIKRVQKDGKSSHAGPADLCLSAAFLSFVVLSWNMLNFLLVSYARWAGEHEMTGPRSYTSFGDLRELARYVWVWSTSSTLFETFAEDLLRDTETWKWTMLSLLYHYACNVYISAIGHRHHIPHLWVYFVLNQILPVSFTQNLFFTMMKLLADDFKAVRTPQLANRLLRLFAMVLYIGLLCCISSTLRGQWFIPALLLTRMVLFAPFLLDLVSYKNKGTWQAENRVQSSNLCCLLILAAFGICSIMDPQRLAPRDIRTSAPNYAAAALSNDLLIGLASSPLYKIL